MYLRACAVASTSKPANTVVRWSGFFSFLAANNIPGLAAPAEHPHTELNTNKVVPSLRIALSTAVGVVRSSKPAPVSSDFIGLTNVSGYMAYKFKYAKVVKNTDVRTLSSNLF